MSRVIGIDLGTTNSCVAAMEGFEAVVLPNAEGARTTPSVVGFPESGEPLVGQIAKRQAVTNAENTVYAVKRIMGRKLDDPEVDRHRKASSYGMTAASNGDAWVRVRDRDYAPAQVSAMVLEKMKRTAEDYLGDKVTDAVITVPAYFNDSQRQATRDAGKIAGLNVLRIINEPTAAALAYGTLSTAQTRRFAVYDLGGGTFDISLLQLHEGVYQVKASSGDGFLGGEDFDARLITFLAENFQKSFGIDLRPDRMALQRLREAAEKAKHELSTSLETEVNLPFIAAAPDGPKHLVASLTRGKLETLTQDLVDRTFAPCDQAFKDAGWTKADIDDVILVGGQTRMPLVQEKVAAYFGKKPSRGVNPDEVVAVGAALQGAVLAGDKQDVLLLDVTPLSLGVETAGGVFTRLIPRNTTIPVRRAQVFSTAVDNQSYVNIHVLQGERDMAGDNKSLAHFQLTGIPPAPRGGPQIEVSFDIDSNGIVSVSARDLGTGKAQKVEVRPTSGLSQAEIDSFIAEAETNRAADVVKKEWADLGNRAEMLFYASETAMSEFGAKVTPEARERLVRQIAELRALLEGQRDLVGAQKVFDLVEASAQKLFESRSFMTQLKRDHYGVLGVGRTASPAEIKAAYRRLALRWHPDRNAGDRAAEERFKEVSVAYAVLGDEDKRAHYDRFGEVPTELPFGGGADLQSATDFFDAIFGDLFGLGRKRAQGQDLRYTLELEFEEAALGCEKPIRFSRQEDCRSCSGTGAEGGTAGLSACKRCNGQGFTKPRGGIFSPRRECLACAGAGEVPIHRCPGCSGTGLVEREKDYVVRVPPASVAGTIQRVAGEGSPGRRGGAAGDLFVNVRVRPHAFYKEEEGLLTCELPLSPSEATLGAEVEVPLLDTTVRMKVPPGTQSGTVFRVRGRGMPRPGGLARGDAHVRVAVETPVELSVEARALFEKAQTAVGADSFPRRQAFRALTDRGAVAADAQVAEGKQ